MDAEFMNFLQSYECCFPKNNPHKIPSGIGDISTPAEKFSRITPALAKANNGIIPKATNGDKECSNLKSNE